MRLCLTLYTNLSNLSLLDVKVGSLPKHVSSCLLNYMQNDEMIVKSCAFLKEHFRNFIYLVWIKQGSCKLARSPSLKHSIWNQNGLRWFSCAISYVVLYC